jgi:hypothetical protein
VLLFSTCPFGHAVRIGFLYGTFNEEDKSANVDFIYEPPQECTDCSFELLEDPLAVCLTIVLREAFHICYFGNCACTSGPSRETSGIIGQKKSRVDICSPTKGERVILGFCFLHASGGGS